ncbi:hypothetical protein BH23CHL2_BH23CHL2_05950 [soil metagenome]
MNYLGRSSLLNQELLGLFCSGRCPGNLILQTYDLAVALRDAGVAVVSGFHSPMEQECLRLLLRGQQPVVICPARSIVRMRIPGEWREPIESGRLLVVSPFDERHRRPTAKLAGERNRFVAALASRVFVAHASPGGKTEALVAELLGQGRRVLTFDDPENRHLLDMGAEPVGPGDLPD